MKLKSLFFMPALGSTSGGPTASISPSMAVLQAAINHYSALLPKSKLMGSSSSQQLNAQQVAALIREGYQTLSLHQYATTSSNGNRRANRSNGGSGGYTSNGGSASPVIVQSPAEVAAYLLYDPLPKLRESDERIYFKR